MSAVTEIARQLVRGERGRRGHDSLGGPGGVAQVRAQGVDGNAHGGQHTTLRLPSEGGILTGAMSLLEASTLLATLACHTRWVALTVIGISDSA